MPPQDDDLSSLERARQKLYSPQGAPRAVREALRAAGRHGLPHDWGDTLEVRAARGARHVRAAAVVFGLAVAFFLVAGGVALYLFYGGGTSVSINNIDVALQGPSTVAAGDTVPISLAITNRNPTAIQNATLEIDFPDGTRSATDVSQSYPRYTENLGTIESGQTVTRAVKAVVFGASGEALTLPVSLSYGIANSNAVFVKKANYNLSISSTPLSVSVDTLSETVSGAPLTLTLTVRNNATVPLSNVVLEGAFPFGFQVASSSKPLSGSSFLLGTLQPGDAETILLSGTLTGQDNESRVFNFTVGTGSGPADPTPAIAYMTQGAEVTIAAPFIATSLAINGVTSANPVLTPGAVQTVTVSYTNTLPTSVTNAVVAIALSGSGIDYNSIRTTRGFYDSTTRTVRFTRDNDPSLANLAPGASGVDTFSFSTLPPGSAGVSPVITFTSSVSGTRIGQANVPEAVQASVTQNAKIATALALVASSLHASGPFENTGPVPPRSGTATTYTIVWNLSDKGSAAAGAVVTAILPNYVSYTGKSTGTGSVSYDDASRTVTWSAGDLPQGGAAQAAFQVSITPSTSQRGSAPVLVGPVGASAYDRYAGVSITGSADPVTTETKADPGYVPANATVQ